MAVPWLGRAECPGGPQASLNTCWEPAGPQAAERGGPWHPHPDPQQSPRSLTDTSTSSTAVRVDVTSREGAAGPCVLFSLVRNTRGGNRDLWVPVASGPGSPLLRDRWTLPAGLGFSPPSAPEPVPTGAPGPQHRSLSTRRGLVSSGPLTPPYPPWYPPCPASCPSTPATGLAA